MAIIRTRRLAAGVIPGAPLGARWPETKGTQGFVYTAPSGFVTILRHADLATWKSSPIGDTWTADVYGVLTKANGDDVVFFYGSGVGRTNLSQIAIVYGHWTGTCVLEAGDQLFCETDQDTPLHYQLSGAQLPVLA